MSLAKFRAALYRLASLLGDVNAIRRGKIVQRVGRKVATRATMQALGGLFRGR